MKYTISTPPQQCFMRQSLWYQSAGKVKIRGVLWHSTGANNPYIKRYVQPDDNASDRMYWLNTLGINSNGNDWNHTKNQKGVHAFIGRLINNEVSTVQVGDWDKRAWGCGSGKYGTCNNGWIQFEICEDALTDDAYCSQVYQEAVELTAYLCKLYNLDPLGTVQYNNVTVPVILCHQDSYKLGLGSNHSDILHWFPKFGKTMQDVRNDVAALIAADIEEEEEMTLAQFKELMKEYRTELQDNNAGEWSKEARTWAINVGLIQGVGSDDSGELQYAWEDNLSREQMCVLLYRFAKMIGRA